MSSFSLFEVFLFRGDMVSILITDFLKALAWFGVEELEPVPRIIDFLSPYFWSIPGSPEGEIRDFLRPDLASISASPKGDLAEFYNLL